MMTTRWFGRAYGAPYELDTPLAATPVGRACGRCNETIVEGDDGLIVPLLGGDAAHADVPYHYECHLRGIVGGLNHQLGRCTCCGGTEPPDPPNMSRREAARLAVKNWQVMRRRRP